jgi:hypothetical protein
LKRKDLATFLLEQLPWVQRRALDQDAPERLSVPSGSQIRLVYEPAVHPCWPRAIQELFGLGRNAARRNADACASSCTCSRRTVVRSK